MHHPSCLLVWDGVTRKLLLKSEIVNQLQQKQTTHSMQSGTDRDCSPWELRQAFKMLESTPGDELASCLTGQVQLLSPPLLLVASRLAFSQADPARELVKAQRVACFRLRVLDGDIEDGRMPLYKDCHKKSMASSDPFVSGLVSCLWVSFDLLATTAYASITPTPTTRTYLLWCQLNP